MIGRRKSVDGSTRDAAVRLLATGKVTLPEMARVLGVSTHVVWNWCRLGRVDWKQARLNRVVKAWNQARPR